MFSRLRKVAAASALLVTPLLGSIAMPIAVHAAVDTCTWTGAVSSSFSNGGNWTGCDNSNVPQNGDNLAFDLDSFSNPPTNDMTGMSFANLTFTGTASSSFGLNGTAFTLTGDIISDTDGAVTIVNNVAFTGSNATINVDETAGLELNGAVSGSGMLTKAGDGYLNTTGAFTYGGAVKVTGAGQFSVKASTTDAPFSSLTINGDGGYFSYDPFTNSGVGTTYTFTKPITLNGGVLYLRPSAGSPSTVNLTGTLTLGAADSGINAGTDVAVHIKGALVGPGFTLKAYGNGQVLNESTSNTSDTPSGLLAVDTSSGAGAAGEDAAAPAAPKTPDTGFTLVAAHPLQTLIATLVAVAAISGIAYKTRKHSLN